MVMVILAKKNKLANNKLIITVPLSFYNLNKFPIAFFFHIFERDKP